MVDDLAERVDTAYKINPDTAADNHLQILTDHLIENPLKNEGLDLPKLLISEDDHNNLTVATENGFVINDMLPPGTKIKYSKYAPNFSPKRYGFLNETIFVSENFDRDGLAGLISFSHEAGHAISPASKTALAERSRLEIECAKAQSPQNRIQVLCKLFNFLMELEVSAWDHGKAVADNLGVSEEQYEDLMSSAVPSHFFYQLRRIFDELPSPFLLKDDESLNIYDPLASQAIVQIPYKEVVAWLDANDDRTALEKASQSFSRVFEKSREKQ